ncbi:MAG: hypothetical protein GXO92_09025 [FCB group bacterium]|nr:hypothetical protein [FCB group bacterium]
MMTRLSVLLVFCTLLVAQGEQTSVRGQSGFAEKLPIAVLTLEGKGVSPNEAEILTERLRSALVQNGRYQVVERSQMEAVLEEQGFQQTGCTTNECLVQAGLILGVVQMVGGTVGRLGNSYTIDIRLFDVESTQIVKAVSRNYQGEIDQLLNIMPEIAEQLAGVGRSPSEPAKATPPQVLLTDEDLRMGMDAIGEALTVAGQAIGKSFSIAGETMDSTARTMRRFFTPKPKNPDIELGWRQGKLDAHDYQRKFMWLVAPFIPAVVTAAADLNREGIIIASLFSGWMAKKIYAMLEGEPVLPSKLAEKIREESVIYQENYRKAWVKEVKTLRSRRGNTGCILGVTIGLLANSRLY